jgi:hypothetical protein
VLVYNRTRRRLGPHCALDMFETKGEASTPR